MAFTILDNDEAFAANPQSLIMQTDIDILVAALGGVGVISGCAVTAQGTPDMTLAVASGTVRIGGSNVLVTAGDVTVTTAHASNPRVDLVAVDNSGTKSVTAGTAAANAKAPDVPANSVVIAMVYLPAADTAIQSNQITDKRAMILVSSGSSGGSLTITEVDGSPSVTATTLKFPNGTLVDDGGGIARYVPSSSTSPELGYAESTSDFTTTSDSYVDVTSLAVTVTIGTRPVIVEFMASEIRNDTDGKRAFAIIYDSTAAAQIQLIITTASASGGNSVHGMVRVAPAAGSRTYKIQAKRENLSGNCVVRAGSTNPAFIRVYEV